MRANQRGAGERLADRVMLSMSAHEDHELLRQMLHCCPCVRPNRCFCLWVLCRHIDFIALSQLVHKSVVQVTMICTNIAEKSAPWGWMNPCGCLVTIDKPFAHHRLAFPSRVELFCRLFDLQRSLFVPSAPQVKMWP